MDNSISNKNKKWLLEYLNSCKLQGKSEHTLRNYRLDLEKFLLWLQVRGPHSLIKIKGELIGEYKEFLKHGGVITQRPTLFKRFLFLLPWIFKTPPLIRMERRPLSMSAQKRHLSSLKNFFDFLKARYEDNEGIFKINPVKPKIHNIRLKDIHVKNTKFLTREDFEKLNEGIYRPQDRLMIYLLYYGGLRLSELTYLKWSHFHQDSGYLIFPRKGGSIHKHRPQKFSLILDQLNRLTPISEYIFADKKGRPRTPRGNYGKIKKMLQKFCHDSELSPHSFRKSCATELYHQTKDIILVRDYLNHLDAKVTQTYLDPIALEQYR